MSSSTLSTILFLTFVAATLGITFWASRNTKTAADYYAGGRSFTGVQNGLAIGGDYMSAASFLGIAGMIALSGYDGFLYSIGFLVAWLVALLLVAELMRNSGKFTMADVLAFRMSPRPVRTAAGVSTIVVSIFYLLAQMVGAGALVGLLLGITSAEAKNWTIVAVGALMIVYVVFGGMKGTTWVQIVKAVLLMGGAALITVLVLAKYNFNLSALLGAATEASGKGAAFLEPGLKYGTEAQGLMGKIDLISLGLALVLGTAGLPHILIRFYTVPTAKDARKSVLWGIGIIGTFYLLTLVLGFGAAALVKIPATDTAGNTAAPQLAAAIGENFFGSVGGTVLLALIGAVAFATILAVVAGLTLASSSSFAHDLYAHVFKKGTATEREEVVVARVSALVIGAAAIGLGILAQGQNVAFLVALAFAVAASGNLPAILYSLFWKRFNTAGAVASIYGGLISCLILVVFSPVVSGSKTALIKGADFHIWNLSNPGIISIPLGFFFGWLGTVLSKEYNAAKYAEIEVRSLTGVGAEKATEH
ncbi:solute symporter family protein [Nonomuraea endophytica]|uniref:Cation/acetate symporter n=1 Tax=Nonomuraea endophytica TaxID=714136 RepID=A0A7W8A201_9ACTN|nr:cation acetate symporter [Nonomuraea endophytica]MBB5078058.1 cation/acetate symporter [Nonomuraea endophytica]